LWYQYKNKTCRSTLEEGELDKSSVVRKFRTTATDGKNYNTIHYKTLPPVEEEYLECNNIVKQSDFVVKRPANKKVWGYEN